MCKKRVLARAVVMLAVFALASCGRHGDRSRATWTTYLRQPAAAGLAIEYPSEGAVFPPEMPPPTFRWTETQAGAEEWLVAVQLGEDTNCLFFMAQDRSWTPPPRDWEIIKQRSTEKPAAVTVVGVGRAQPDKIISAGHVAFATSRDPVGAPLFYREVNLPFIEAVKDPSQIRWRFGPISSPQPPPVVLEHLPVCGNCHSFPRDGRALAMDVDYGNNKGSYIMTAVAEKMHLVTNDIITWDDYRRDEGDSTLGLLSQISPDGRYVVSTVKDQSVFVDRPGLEFSQLFFPVKGILVIYDRQRKTFEPLPGADDPRYVQSNPAWSPDGKTLVFARAPAHDLKLPGKFRQVLLSAEECRDFLIEGKPFRYDLYRIPFNGGKGGQAEALTGASGNGRSNFFPKYSPDGRWIVYCRANSYMLLQPDSELWIIPATGGTARKLGGNAGRMNSWHSWSPNGRWLVFSSKVNGPYTQLWLTHMGEGGESTPPVVLAQMSAPDRAANIPEFVGLPSTAIRNIHEEFLDDYSFVRAGNAFFKRGDVSGAIRQFEQALQLNPANAHAHQRLGYLLYNEAGKAAEGLAHTREALRLDPRNSSAHFDMAMALGSERNLGAASPRPQIEELLGHIREALRLEPEGMPPYVPQDMLFYYGRTLLWNRQFKDAASSLNASARLDPTRAETHYLLAFAQAQLGLIQEPVREIAAAKKLDPNIDRSAVLHDRLGMSYSQMDAFPEALAEAAVALRLAETTRQTALVVPIRERMDLYRQRKPWLDPPPGQ